MGGEFNVFDEWGNYMGKFTPAGEGDGCLSAIALLSLGTVGFLVYLLARLVTSLYDRAVAGIFQALFKRKPKGPQSWIVMAVPLVSILALVPISAIVFGRDSPLYGATVIFAILVLGSVAFRFGYNS